MSHETKLTETMQNLSDIDKLIHEPARLMILAFLTALESTDFLFLMRQTNLTQGNLSSHLARLEQADYIEVKKEFIGKRPHTILSLTEAGRKAFNSYRKQMQDLLNGLSGSSG